MCPQVPGHYPLAEWGLLSDSDVEAMYPILERSLGVLMFKMLMFKMLEQFRDPADYRAPLAVMFPDSGDQPRVHNLHSVTHNILQRRNWTWLLGHPGVGRLVHPDRSMPSHA